MQSSSASFTVGWRTLTSAATLAFAMSTVMLILTLTSSSRIGKSTRIPAAHDRSHSQSFWSLPVGNGNSEIGALVVAQSSRTTQKSDQITTLRSAGLRRPAKIASGTGGLNHQASAKPGGPKNSNPSRLQAKPLVSERPTSTNVVSDVDIDSYFLWSQWAIEFVQLLAINFGFLCLYMVKLQLPYASPKIPNVECQAMAAISTQQDSSPDDPSSEDPSLKGSEPQKSSRELSSSLAKAQISSQQDPSSGDLSSEADDLLWWNNHPILGSNGSKIVTAAAAIGILTGASVVVFKLGIEFIKTMSYGEDGIFVGHEMYIPLIPAFGGVVVSILREVAKDGDGDGDGGGFTPGLAGYFQALQSPNPFKPKGFVLKSMGAVSTLGSGCSLGPEGPAVELGMGASRLVTGHTKEFLLPERYLLLSAGCAAGVSAGFNAPIAGIIFALEIAQDLIPRGNARDLHLSSQVSIGAILVASLASGLVAAVGLNNESAIKVPAYTLNSYFVELPLYLGLGFLAGCVAFLYQRAARTSQKSFDSMTTVPSMLKPIIGGLACGVVGIWLPEILFFGYDTLNQLLDNQSMGAGLLLTLLAGKIIMTAVSQGSGLIGGTFAPSLFMGATLGSFYHNIIVFLTATATHYNEEFDASNVFYGASFFSIPLMQVGDQKAYAMVGAASVLSALFKAPLTGSILLFELTRNYDIVLPLVASASTATLVANGLDHKFPGAVLAKDVPANVEVDGEAEG